MVEEQVVEVKLTGVGLADILTDKFVRFMAKSGSNLKAVNLILVSEKKDSKNKATIVVPVSLSHSNSQEVEQKILHVGCSEQKILEEVKEVLKSIGGT